MADEDFVDEEPTRPIKPETLVEVADRWISNLPSDPNARLCGRLASIAPEICGDDLHEILRADVKAWERLAHVAMIPSGETTPGAHGLIDLRRCPRCARMIARPIGPRNAGGRMR